MGGEQGLQAGCMICPSALEAACKASRASTEQAQQMPTERQLVAVQAIEG